MQNRNRKSFQVKSDFFYLQKFVSAANNATVFVYSGGRNVVGGTSDCDDPIPNHI